MAFPADGKNEIPFVYPFRKDERYEITDIYPDGEHVDLTVSPTGRLLLVPYDETVEVYNTSDKLPTGKFQRTGSRFPNPGQFFLDHTTGDFIFNAFDTWHHAYWYYQGKGSLVTVAWNNRVGSVIGEIQDWVLNEAIPSGVAVNARLSSIDATIVSIQNNYGTKLWVSTQLAVASSYFEGRHSQALAYTNQKFTEASGLYELNRLSIVGINSDLSHFHGDVNALLIDYSGHKSAVNPHGITPAMIGAAPTSHHHDDRYYLKTEVDYLISNMGLAELQAHLSDSGNPHHVTYQQVGAAPANHNHDDLYPRYANLASSSGVAPIHWSHITNVPTFWGPSNDGSGSGLDADLWDGHEYGDLSVPLSGVIESLAAHLVANNPHNITLAGLGGSPLGHTHDDRYYLKAAVDSLLSPLATTAALEALEDLLEVHEEDTANPHEVSLEQARSVNSTLSGSINMGGYGISAVADPSGVTDVATKGYVDALVQGVDWREPVRIADAPSPPTVYHDYELGDRVTISARGSYPLGPWTDHDNQIATLVEGTGSSESDWSYETPDVGWSVYETSTGRQWVYNGVDWVTFGSTTQHGDLLGLTEDHHTQYYNSSRLATYLGSWDDSIWASIGSLTDQLNALDFVPASGGTFTGKVYHEAPIVFPGMDMEFGGENDAFQFAGVSPDLDFYWGRGTVGNLTETYMRLFDQGHLEAGSFAPYFPAPSGRWAAGNTNEIRTDGSRVYVRTSSGWAMLGPVTLMPS